MSDFGPDSEDGLLAPEILEGWCGCPRKAGLILMYDGTDLGLGQVPVCLICHRQIPSIDDKLVSVEEYERARKQ